jgi:hypothetical protein
VGEPAGPTRRGFKARVDSAAGATLEAWVDDSVVLGAGALDALAVFEKEALGPVDGRAELGPADLADAVRRKAGGALSVVVKRETGAAAAVRVEDRVTRITPLAMFPRSSSRFRRPAARREPARGDGLVRRGGSRAQEERPVRQGLAVFDRLARAQALRGAVSLVQLVALLVTSLVLPTPEAQAQTDPWALTPGLTAQAVFSCDDLTLNASTADSAPDAGQGRGHEHASRSMPRQRARQRDARSSKAVVRTGGSTVSASRPSQARCPCAPL